MRKNIIQKRIQIIVLAISLVYALILSFFGEDSLKNIFPFFSEDIYIRSVLFLVGTFFFEALLERVTTFNQIDKIEEAFQKNVSPFFARFYNDPKKKRFYELLWKYVFRGRTTIPPSDYRSFEVDRRNSIYLWRDCISESGSWKALSYAQDLWLNHEVKISQAHQDLFINLRGYLSRVFVFDSQEDVINFQENEINMEIIATGETYWILKDTLIKAVEEHTQQKFPDPQLIDFAIANENDYVLWFHTDEKSRRLNSAELTIEIKIVDIAATIFSIARSEGHRFD